MQAIQLPQYVALGSSFAAGLGLGQRSPGSPFFCMRSDNGYPQQLSRIAGLSLVDVSCSGATTKHILRGGQFFQPAQLDAIDAATELVTLTAGGNDVSYIRDLALLAWRKKRGLTATLLRLLWRGPRSPEGRDFATLRSNFDAILEEITRRAPQARVVVVTYPAVLPETGTCPKLGISEQEAALMRTVADRLADVTRRAALAAGATVIDMAILSAGHHACSCDAWTFGDQAKAPAFHPTLSGAEATAREIWQAIADTPLDSP
jgi:lysophospholipase L1-like esterase